MKRHWRILRSQTRPLRFLISRLLWRSGLSRFFLIRQDGFCLRFYPSSLSASLWIDPDGRAEDERFLTTYLRPGDRVVDVGANIGSTALAASVAVGAAGLVIAIEAHPRIFAFLKGNLALNRASNVEAYNFAVGNQEGVVHFSSKRSDDQNSVVSDCAPLSVPIRTLDDVLNDERPIDLLKIDVEGYERFVLEGAVQVLRRIRCIYFESWNRHAEKYGYDSRDLFDLLAKLNFQVFRFLGEDVVPIPPGYSSVECENLVAIREPEPFFARIAMGRTGVPDRNRSLSACGLAPS